MTRSIIATLEERFLSPDGSRYQTIGITSEELREVIIEASTFGALRDHPEFAAYKRAADQTAANLRAELERYSMDAGHAEQRQAESRACREALGFEPDSDHVSPADLREAIAKTASAHEVLEVRGPSDCVAIMELYEVAYSEGQVPESFAPLLRWIAANYPALFELAAFRHLPKHY